MGQDISSRIEMYYRDIEKKADELTALADRLAQLGSSEINEVCMGLRGTWEGSSAKSYQEKVNKLRAKVSEQERSLRRTATNLRASAERSYQVEKMGMALFGKR